MEQIAIFASGTGSNAKAIIQYFNGHDSIKVNCLLSNKPSAKALEMAASFGIDSKVISQAELEQPNLLIDYLKDRAISLIVLAGYLKKIPARMVEAFPNAIINIHPALLPDFGGKGMYGMHVHQAVVDAGVGKSGMTIHYVNEVYDDGGIIFQASVDLEETDQAADVARKVLTLEHKHYPEVIEQLLLKRSQQL